MRLLLMRHAAAAKPNAKKYPDDDERPLTKTGRKTHSKASKALKRMGWRFSRIVSSPRVRAWETAHITAAVLNQKKRVEPNDALGNAYSPTAVLDMLEEFAEDSDLLLVGHEPDLSELAGVLLGPDAGPDIDFVKSGVLGIGFEGRPRVGDGTLLFFYRPDDLIALL
jgi:phosphohistidine phosphatase